MSPMEPTMTIPWNRVIRYLLQIRHRWLNIWRCFDKHHRVQQSQHSNRSASPGNCNCLRLLFQGISAQTIVGIWMNLFECSHRMQFVSDSLQSNRCQSMMVRWHIVERIVKWMFPPWRRHSHRFHWRTQPPDIIYAPFVWLFCCLLVQFLPFSSSAHFSVTFVLSSIRFIFEFWLMMFRFTQIVEVDAALLTSSVGRASFDARTWCLMKWRQRRIVKLRISRNAVHPPRQLCHNWKIKEEMDQVVWVIESDWITHVPSRNCFATFTPQHLFVVRLNTDSVAFACDFES